MEDQDKDEILEQETEEATEEITDGGEDADGTEDFEYDEDGNIIVGGEADTEENAEVSEDADGEQEEPRDDGAEEDTADTEEPESEDTASEGTDKGVSAKYAELQDLAKDMLEKLGVKNVTDEGLVDAMIKIAAEAADMTVDEYKKVLDDKARKKQAQREAIVSSFETVAAADLAALKAAFPELQDLKHIKNLPNWEDFGRLRDMGFSPAVAYKMVRTENVTSAPAKQPHKKALEGTKNHLKSVTGKSAQGGTAMPKAKLSEWRQMFPHKSDKEIERLYKATM